MNKKITRIFSVMLLLAFNAPLTVFAVSYAPAPLFHRQERGEKTVMKVGDTVYLFHSGTEDIRKNIHPNDLLTVYRIKPSCEVIEVGKLMVLSYIGETYLKGEVVEGEIRPDDIAKKGNVSCLIISAGMCNP
jgi:hypothetical protein